MRLFRPRRQQRIREWLTTRALRGKRERAGAASSFLDLERNLLCLQQELLAQTYRPWTYRSFRIRDPKPRLTSALPIRDQVMHHALVGVMEHVLERRVIGDSYACRTGNATNRALDRFVRWARTNASQRHESVSLIGPSQSRPSTATRVVSAAEQNHEPD